MARKQVSSLIVAFALFAACVAAAGIIWYSQMERAEAMQMRAELAQPTWPGDAAARDGSMSTAAVDASGPKPLLGPPPPLPEAEVTPMAAAPTAPGPEEARPAAQSRPAAEPLVPTDA